jgi:hypothetical protein
MGAGGAEQPHLQPSTGCHAIDGNRAKKLFQFLNEIGARALGRHLGRVLEMAESSADKWECESKIAQRFGFEQQLELPIPRWTWLIQS